MSFCILPNPNQQEPWAELTPAVDELATLVSTNPQVFKETAEKAKGVLQNPLLRSDGHCVICLNEAIQELESGENIARVQHTALNAISDVRVLCARRWQGIYEQSFLGAIVSQNSEIVFGLLNQQIRRPDLVIAELPAKWTYHSSEEPITRITAIGLACLTGNVEIVRSVMAHGADPNFYGMPPAWFVLLCSPLSTDTKMKVWSEIQGKSDLMTSSSENSKWLSKTSGAFSAKPQELHLMLRSVVNLREKAHPNILWNSETIHDVQMGAVMICHGLLRNTQLSHEPANFKGTLMSLQGVHSLRLQREKEYRESLQEQYQGSTTIGLDLIRKDPMGIVSEYMMLTADEINRNIADQCVEELF